VTTRVLVVDDNEDNLRIVNQILKTRGWEVRLARDGASALAAVEAERPDIILLDVMMPEMDGMQVLDRIRASPRSASVPVILVTAKGQDDDVLAGYKGGADYYITKPFTARRLLYGIDLVLGGRSAE
jgi:DNA-binding response OmpR family regulator